MANYRFEKRHQQRQRKINRVYNMLIAVVVILIVIIGGRMMFGSSEEKAASEKQTSAEQSSKDRKANTEEADTEQTEDVMDIYEDTETAVETELEQKENEELTQAGLSESETFEEDMADPSSNEADNFANSEWQPIGTQQSEPHETTYEKGTVDWNEMLQAVSYATGVGIEDMTVWHAGNNGGPHKAAVTISSKSQQIKYRVQIDWIENEGWKPIAVEKLS